ncbi:MAG: hypothetical protein JST01_20800, partial [Cyanobacteria bacterium SZAS TMP-1]|nr:hypothetical protein [Cyanobacteria bacterium SZAS TMP-1]
MKSGSPRKATRRPFSFIAGARRIVPCALSVVLIAQGVLLSLPGMALAALADETQAAPSWNDVSSGSAEIFENKSIAEATKVLPVENATTSSANILTPAEVDAKAKAAAEAPVARAVEVKEAEKPAETTEVLVVDDAAPKASEPVKSTEPVKSAETLKETEPAKAIEPTKAIESAKVDGTLTAPESTNLA